MPSRLSHEERVRYSRQLLMPEVGQEGQERLKERRILLIGAGGLGAPAGMYLAAAGVGTLGLVDFDVVDLSNLQRQVLFGSRDIGRSKLDAAAERLRGLNPHVDIVTHDAKLTSDNALALLGSYDIVVDGTDNFPTRYLVNDACVILAKPNVYGSILRFQGQASVFSHAGGPCYRCLYPDPPPPGAVPSCAEAGVLGVLPGIIGAIQANEALKLALGAGECLRGRLLLFDALNMSFRELQVNRNPECPVCGDAPTITELVDYEAFCGAPAEEPLSDSGIPEMTALELKKRIDESRGVFILDVREPHEFDFCNIGGHLVPLGELPARLREIDGTRDVVVVCRSGRRSASAVDFLIRAGFRRVWNLRGGILAWSDDVDPTVPKY